MEDVVGQVDGEAAAGGGGRAVQGARAALLGAVGGTRLEAEQTEHRGHGDGGANGGEVDGRPLRVGWLTRLLRLSAFVLGLAYLLAAFACFNQLAVAFGAERDRKLVE